ncbi:MAG: ABC transporter ATP-binding protein [Erysipelotrichaceae bacterium]
MAILKVNNVYMNFGGICAVSNCNFEINKGELVGLIGPNGAGKTTLFNMLTGVYKPSSGSIVYNFDKEYLTNNYLPYQISKLGISRTFQNIRLFKNLTVLDNIKIAMSKDVKYGFIDGILRTSKFYKEEEVILEKSLELLKILGLYELKDELSSNLAYGKQRCLEIARALATSPKIIFLDEPAAGMNPQETAILTSLIKEIQEKFDLTIVLIEHDMNLVMNICERIIVLNYGKVIAVGTPDQIKHNDEVIKAYLGGE